MLTLQSSVGIGLAIYIAGLLTLCIIRYIQDK